MQIAKSHPAATLGLRSFHGRRVNLNLGDIDRKLQMEMGEGVLDEARHFAPSCFDRRMIEGRLGVLLALGPMRGWSFKHTAEQAFQRPLAQENGTVLAPDDEGSPTPGRPYWLGLTVGQNSGKALGMASTG